MSYGLITPIKSPPPPDHKLVRSIGYYRFRKAWTKKSIWPVTVQQPWRVYGFTQEGCQTLTAAEDICLKRAHQVFTVPDQFPRMKTGYVLYIKLSQHL